MGRKANRKLERQRRERAKSESIQLELHQSFQGPLPPPRLLAEYDALIPGSAERFIDMVERQQEHRQSLEKAHLDGGIASEKRGQYLAAGLLAAMTLVGGWLVYVDKPTEGFALLVGELVVGGGAFVYGRRQQRQERQDKFDRFRQSV